MNSNSVNIPGGVNLTIAICALVGATLSIVGFFAHYVPHHQYRQFCETIQDVNIIIDNDWRGQPPDDLWFHYNMYVSPQNMEIFDFELYRLIRTSCHPNAESRKTWTIFII